MEMISYITITNDMQLKLIGDMNPVELEIEIKRLQYYVNSNKERGRIDAANSLKDKISYAKRRLASLKKELL